MKSNKFLAIAAAAAALLATPLASQAVPVFAAKISDGVNTVTIVDGGAGDSAAADGIIAYVGIGLFGNWDISFTTGTSTYDPLQMHLSTNFSTQTGNFGVGESKQLTVSLSQTGLSSGAGTSVVAFGANGGGSGFPGVTTGWTAYADDSDALFGTGTTVVASNTFSTASGGVMASMTDLYSATLVAKFDISGVAGPFAAASQDLTMQVPEPGTIALAGLGLLALGAMRRRKA